MDPQPLTGAGRSGAELPRVVQGVDRLGHVPLYQLCRMAGRRVAQQKNGQPDAALPELDGLLQIGDRQGIRAEFCQSAADGHSAVTVGIGFDHAHETAARGDMIADSPVILVQGIQGDLCPCPLHPLHRATSFPVSDVFSIRQLFRKVKTMVLMFNISETYF